jgi:hypothetical protein
MNWNKAFVLVDVSVPNDTKYWKLVEWLKENEFDFVDANFSPDDD